MTFEVVPPPETNFNRTKGAYVENSEPIQAKQIVKRVLKKLKPMSSPTYIEGEITLDEIKASIAERQQLRESMRQMWMFK
jgi:ribosome-interacting GTPase 1